MLTSYLNQLEAVTLLSNKFCFKL